MLKKGGQCPDSGLPMIDLSETVIIWIWTITNLRVQGHDPGDGFAWVRCLEKKILCLASNTSMFFRENSVPWKIGSMEGKVLVKRDSSA